MSRSTRRPGARLQRVRVVVAATVAAVGLGIVGASPAWAHDWELTQPAITIAEGVEFSGVVSCIEPTAGGSFNTSDFEGTIDWGDGTDPTSATIGGGGISSPCFIDVQGTHTYAVAGTYDVFVLVRDLTLDGHLSFGYQGTATVTVRANDLSVSAGATPNPVRTGKNLIYTVRVTNGSGDGNIASDVRATLTLPPQTQFVSLSASAGTCVAPSVGTTGAITCLIGSMSANAGWTLTATVKVVARGGSSVQATATTDADDPDPFGTNNSATVATSVFGRR